MRRRARIDKNHAEIVAALRAVGCSVQSLASIGHGCPDLLVGFQGRDVLMEVKSVGGKLTADEADWHGAWKGEKPIVVWSVDEALCAVLGGTGTRDALAMLRGNGHDR